MQEKKKFYYGWYMVLFGFLVMALAYASLASCQGIFIKPVTEELGIERATFSGVTTIASVGLIIGSTFMGKLFGKYSLKKVMGTCCTIVCTCLAGFGFSSHIWQFYILGSIMGIAFSGLTIIPVSILINNWFGVKKKGVAMSIAFAGSGIGGMILTVVLNNIIQSIGWRAAYFTDAALIFFVLMPFILFLVVSTPAQKGLSRIGEGEVLKSDRDLTASQAKGTLTFWLIFISFFLISMLNSGLLNHQIPYLSDIGFSASTSANIGALAVGSLSIGKIILGALCDKTSLKTGSFIGNMLFLFAMIALLFTSNIGALAYVYVLLFCVGGAVPTICPPLFVANVFGEKDYGSLVGILNVAAGLGAAVGSLLCGKLYDTTGNYTLCWSSFIIISALIVVMQWVSLHKKPNWNE